MPRNVSVSIENNFTKGLLTEHTGLNFPENACTETWDCVFARTGEVRRRKGMRLEENFDSHTVDDLSGSAITEFMWRTVSLDGELTFLVAQVGSLVNFWSVDENGNASPNLKDFYINLEDYKIAGGKDTEGINCSFASGNGQLFIAHPSCDPIFVEYAPTTDTITQKAIELKVRDLTGLHNYKKGTTEVMDYDHRPTDAEWGVNQYYNLINKGWGEAQTITWNRKFWGFTTPIAAWRHAAVEFVPDAFALFSSGQVNPAALVDLRPGRTDWPSDADQVELCKQPIYPNVDDTGNVVAPVPPAEAFCVNFVDESKPGNTPAPRGQFIYPAFNIDRMPKLIEYNDKPILLSVGEAWALTNGEQIPRETTIARPSAVAFFAGRVFYAGVEDQKYNTRIYFSKILENNQHYDKCYQINDPSNPNNPSNDLLSNDGGIIVIPDVSKIIKLLPIGNNMLVFCTNGIWAVTGSADGAGFTAVDYKITRISEFGAFSPHSFVVANGVPFWWNPEGIFTISADGNNVPNASNLTLNTIHSFYTHDIPAKSKRYAKGAYSKTENLIQWIYRSTQPTTVQEQFHYDRVLNLDLTTGAYYPWTIGDSCLYVSGIVTLQDTGIAFVDEIVTDGGVDVTDAEVNVTVNTNTPHDLDLETKFKFVVMNECAAQDNPDSLTPDHAFLGEVNETQFTSGKGPVYDSPTGSIIIGEDGKYYVPTLISDFSRRAGVQRFDGTGTLVEYDHATMAAELNSASGLVMSSGASSALVYIPFPYTQYVLAGTWATDTPTNGYYLAFGLYKVNSSGALQYCNSWKTYRCHFSIAFALGSGGAGFPAACDYKEFNSAVTDRHLYLALEGPVSNGWFIMDVPSINQFLAGSSRDDSPSAHPTISTGMNGVIWNIRKYSAISSQGQSNITNCFFLPGPGGIVDKMYRYVDWASCYEHQVSPAGVGHSPVVLAFVNAGHTTGFVMSTPIGGESWSIADSSFKAEDGSNLTPFADVGKDRTGEPVTAADGGYYNDWTEPTHTYAGTTHYLIWTRRYQPIEANQISLGSYTGAMLQEWIPGSETATFIADVYDNPFDTVTELLGDGSRYTAFPRETYTFMDPTTNILYQYAVYSTSSISLGSTQALSKFADFTPGVGSTTMSFGEFVNPSYLDWSDVTTGVDYTSYFTTGYKLRGEGIRKFQSNYLQIYNYTAEDSIFDILSKWDYSTTGSSGRWSSTQRVDVIGGDPYGFKSKRLKMRGHGKALQFMVSSVSEQPFHIIGYTIFETTNAKP